MPKPIKIFDKAVLEKLYLIEQKNPVEIAAIFKCDHKTIRKNLKDFDIPLRSASQYNALARKTYTEPDEKLLFSKTSLILHSIYKCEGITAKSATNLSFINQDPNLIKAFYDGMIKVYKYESEMTLSFLYNFECEESLRTVGFYNLIFNDLKIRHANTPTNKNPIIRIQVGGKHLHKLFIKNTATIFDSIILST